MRSQSIVWLSGLACGIMATLLIVRTERADAVVNTYAPAARVLTANSLRIVSKAGDPLLVVQEGESPGSTEFKMGRVNGIFMDADPKKGGTIQLWGVKGNATVSADEETTGFHASDLHSKNAAMMSASDKGGRFGTFDRDGKVTLVGPER